MDKFYVPNAFIVGFDLATVFINTRHAGLGGKLQHNGMYVAARNLRASRQPPLFTCSGSLRLGWGN